MESAIYKGTLRHRRFRPAGHEFTYSVFFAFLDIDRIPELMRASPFAAYNRFNWAAFDERDHFGDHKLPLRKRLEADALARGVTLSGGPVFLLTNLRYLGYNFNPISLFYCYAPSGALECVLAEVNSTFGESHNYWLTAADEVESGNSKRYRAAKQLHVSPFMPMDLEYAFALTEPGEGLVVHMNVLERGTGFFDATLNLRREPWSASSLHRALIAHPWMTAKVIAAIHWQAARLYFKRVPVFEHPNRKGKEGAAPGATPRAGAASHK